MGSYAGIDMSREFPSVGIIDTTARIVNEAKGGAGPEAHVAFRRHPRFR